MMQLKSISVLFFLGEQLAINFLEQSLSIFMLPFSHHFLTTSCVLRAAKTRKYKRGSPASVIDKYITNSVCHVVAYPGSG